MIEENYRLLCRLNDEGRDHIWSYYIRNLARPAWLARPENRVDVLVGNPPWLSYRHMPEDMQIAFRQMSETRQLWHGREVATQQDLPALFVARTAQQYLSEGGSFAFVMPNAVLDRWYYAGFRAGYYPMQKTRSQSSSPAPGIFVGCGHTSFHEGLPSSSANAARPSLERHCH